MIVKPLGTEEDYKNLVKLSHESPVYLLKHSLICPVSSAAYREFEAFLRVNTSVPGFVVKIQENRALSGRIAEDTGVRHESPQVLLFKDGEVVWNESHYGISARSLKAAVG